ncbi:MAG TPA: vWA domain-containing protein [Rhodanobacteraceae bacterium]|nr:vWA domain-containing protein [Rhodanobacteraceae bacterium]
MLLPVFFAPAVELPGGTFSWLFVIDVSESMNVRDVDARAPRESRLDRAKSSVVAAMAALPCGSRVALALFAGEDTVTLFEPLEVCRHFPAIEQAVRHVDWRMAWDGDSRIELGVVNALREAEKRHLDLVFVTDGDEAPHTEVPRLSDLLSMRGPVRGWLVGVGSAEPHPVPRLDAEDRIVGYWTAIDAARQGFHPNLVERLAQSSTEALEASGALDEVVEHRSALRADYLRQLATAAGLGYAKADSTQSVAALAADRAMRREERAGRDVRFVFGLAAALLLATEWLGASLTRRKRGVAASRRDATPGLRIAHANVPMTNA